MDFKDAVIICLIAAIIVLFFIDQHFIRMYRNLALKDESPIYDNPEWGYEKPREPNKITGGYGYVEKEFQRAQEAEWPWPMFDYDALLNRVKEAVRITLYYEEEELEREREQRFNHWQEFHKEYRKQQIENILARIHMDMDDAIIMQKKHKERLDLLQVGEPQELSGKEDDNERSIS